MEGLLKDQHTCMAAAAAQTTTTTLARRAFFHRCIFWWGKYFNLLFRPRTREGIALPVSGCEMATLSVTFASLESSTSTTLCRRCCIEEAHTAKNNFKNPLTRLKINRSSGRPHELSIRYERAEEAGGFFQCEMRSRRQYSIPKQYFFHRLGMGI